MHHVADEASAPKRTGRGRGRGWRSAFITVLLLVALARGVSGVAATHGAARGARTWSLTGSLITGRGQHTATLLSNGQVLVAGGGFGGDQGETPYASAELYAPRVHRWIATGSMHTRRAGHTATLLHTGQVLVTGGWSGWMMDPRRPSAELYDPRTGRWTVTGRMHAVRMSHTATLLASGKVLVVGGIDLRRQPLASGELYDPRTGAWTVIPPMHAARSGQTATLLPSGKVLVVGGEGGHGVLASAELYDPRTGTWTVTGSLHTARAGHTATLLPNGTVLVAAGSAAAQPLSSAEVYDPRTGRWTVTARMHDARDAHTATLLSNGEVLVAGGQGNGLNGLQILSSAELYDPRTSRWMVTAPMHDARYEHTATLLRDGTVLVAGACCASPDPQSSVELYR